MGGNLKNKDRLRDVLNKDYQSIDVTSEVSLKTTAEDMLKAFNNLIVLFTSLLSSQSRRIVSQVPKKRLMQSFIQKHVRKREAQKPRLLIRR